MDVSVSQKASSPVEQPRDRQREKAPDQRPPIENLIVVGGGPAGFTAALYGARARLAPLVLLGPAPGGQAATTDLMENFPGFPEGVGGQALASLMQEQCESFGAELRVEEVTDIDFSRRPFKITTYDSEYLAKTIIVATGARARLMGVPGEEKFIGRGVSFCATCDGFFYRDKTVAVIGGGDSAVDEALFLTKFARQVYVIHRRAELRANKHGQTRLFSNPKVTMVWNTVVEEVLGEHRVRGVKTRRVDTGEVGELATDGVFVYVGMNPNTHLFEGKLELDSQGYVVTDKMQHTNIAGVFAAGDVQDPYFRQVVIAAGTGAAAAIEAEHFLAANETSLAESTETCSLPPHK
jgi:thioredoxin reductase (NADPH)